MPDELKEYSVTVEVMVLVDADGEQHALRKAAALFEAMDEIEYVDPIDAEEV